jgi:hypothetical protein
VFNCEIPHAGSQQIPLYLTQAYLYQEQARRKTEEGADEELETEGNPAVTDKRYISHSQITDLQSNRTSHMTQCVR